jgi:acyl homoserine lactone synthase
VFIHALSSILTKKGRDMHLINNKQSLTVRRAWLTSVFIQDENYTAKNIINKREMLDAYRLRHKIFCQELGWVSDKSSSFEIDSYDLHAVPIGVFDAQGDLKAFLRIITSRNTFMMEKEFPYLLQDDYEIQKKSDTAEISRLCVDPGARTEKITGNFGVHYVSMILYKGVYHWCLKNNVRYLYLVVEEKVYRLLCAKGFPCDLIGEPRVMPDGVVAVAAMLDWKRFEETNELRRPNMLAWFRLDQLNHSQSRLRQRESCSQRRVFSLR